MIMSKLNLNSLPKYWLQSNATISPNVTCRVMMILKFFASITSHNFESPRNLCLSIDFVCKPIALSHSPHSLKLKYPLSVWRWGTAGRSLLQQLDCSTSSAPSRTTHTFYGLYRLCAIHLTVHMFTLCIFILHCIYKVFIPFIFLPSWWCKVLLMQDNPISSNFIYYLNLSKRFVWQDVTKANQLWECKHVASEILFFIFHKTTSALSWTHKTFK